MVGFDAPRAEAFRPDTYAAERFGGREAQLTLVVDADTIPPPGAFLPALSPSALYLPRHRQDPNDANSSKSPHGKGG